MTNAKALTAIAASAQTLVIAHARPSPVCPVAYAKSKRARVGYSCIRLRSRSRSGGGASSIARCRVFLRRSSIFILFQTSEVSGLAQPPLQPLQPFRANVFRLKPRQVHDASSLL